MNWLPLIPLFLLLSCWCPLYNTSSSDEVLERVFEEGSDELFDTSSSSELPPNQQDHELRLKQLFPHENWLGFEKRDFDRLWLVISKLEDYELKALLDLCTVDVFQPIFGSFLDEFRVRTAGEFELIQIFANSTLQWSRWIRDLPSKIRLLVFGLAIRNFGFAGLVKRVIDCQKISVLTNSLLITQELPLNQCDLVKASNYLYSELLEKSPNPTLLALVNCIGKHLEIESPMNSIKIPGLLHQKAVLDYHMNYVYDEFKCFLVIQHWKSPLSPDVILPFNEDHLFTLKRKLPEKRRFEKFLTIASVILKVYYPKKFYELTSGGLMLEFIKRLVEMLKVKTPMDFKPFYEEFLKATVINDDTFAFLIDLLPETLIESTNDLPTPCKLVADLWNLIPPRIIDFRVQLSRNLGYYCNPFDWNIDSPEQIMDWLNSKGQPMNSIYFLKEKHELALLFLERQPLIAALAVTPDTINDALRFAPMYVIGDALGKLLAFYNTINSKAWSIAWYRRIRLLLRTMESSELIRALLERKGFLNDPLTVGQLFMNRYTVAWEKLFEELPN